MTEPYDPKKELPSEYLARKAKEAKENPLGHSTQTPEEAAVASNTGHLEPLKVALDPPNTITEDELDEIIAFFDA